MVSLNTEKISTLGKYISEELHKCHIKNSEIIVYVTKEDLIKIDEDLFYRLNKENKDDKEFIPSNDEITISFKNLKFIIKKSID